MNMPRPFSASGNRSALPPSPPLPDTIQTLACRWMPLTFFKWCHRYYGDSFTIYPVGLEPVVFLSRPEDIRAVLGASPSVLHPGAGGAAISPIVGDSSFMLREGAEHMLGRKAILPAFNARALAVHAAMIEETTSREVASWPGGSPVAVHQRLRSMSLRIILQTLFDDEPRVVAALHDHMLALLDVTVSFVLIEPRLRRVPPWKGIWQRFSRDRERVDDELRTVICARRAGGERGDVLDMLLRAHNPDGSPMTDVQVRDNLVSLILAGHETTASELAWALHLLAHNPKVQDRLAQEIDAGYEETYLTATVEEVLRHRPVFLFAIPRVVIEPITIGGWTYRPPAQLLACIYLVQHDPHLYDAPHEFRPERFLDRAPAPAEYLPWGGGRKRCPGHRLATLEMRALIRAALATWTLTPAARRLERARWRSVIVTPRAGARVVLTPRLTAEQAGLSVPS
jgi:cytochrome P450